MSCFHEIVDVGVCTQHLQLVAGFLAVCLDLLLSNVGTNLDLGLDPVNRVPETLGGLGEERCGGRSRAVAEVRSLLASECAQLVDGAALRSRLFEAVG